MKKTVLLLEPFYGGSHKQLIDLLMSCGLHYAAAQSSPIALFTLPASKWPWRARCSALHFSRVVPKNGDFRVLFVSCVLNLAELLSLRPDLAQNTQKLVYFHENQLVYPVQIYKERDFQFGYNQILSCLVADVVLFNSSYNCNSFLSSIDGFLGLLPDHRPKGISSEIRAKCRVLYFPIDFTLLRLVASSRDEESRKQKTDDVPLHVIWPHRWEHDKDPEAFFSVMFQLLETDDVPFTLSILGQKYSEVPKIFDEARDRLSSHISRWGFCKDRSSYVDVLRDADVVVSTAKHEFYGVAMLEAVSQGCYPLCPNRLVYPEIFPAECRYNTVPQLRKRLREFCRRPHLVRNRRLELDLSKYDWQTLKKDYMQLLQLSDAGSTNTSEPSFQMVTL